MLAADLTLSGAQTLLGGAYVNASEDPMREQHEITLDVNPTNPLNLAGFSHSSIGRNDFKIDVFYTMDGGLSWETTRIDDAEDGRTAPVRFDPSIAFDADGNLFIAYGVRNAATLMTELVVARSQNGGETFDQFIEVDTAPGIDSLDKWHLATGPSGPNNAGQAVYVAYTLQTPNPNVLNIYVAGSNDGGATFTAPELVSDDVVVTDFYADPAVGPNGELYIAWWNTFGDELRFDRDLNGLWVEGTPADEFGTDATIVSLSTRVSGLSVPAQPERGINAAPVLDVDRSGGPNEGRLYLTYVDIATGQTQPNSDIYLVTSDDGGASWSSTATGALQGNVEDSTGTEFNPWVDVDQTTGSVNLIYYTTDGNQQADNDEVNARLASSIDGGATFVYTDLSPFTSNEEDGSDLDYMEYIGLAVHDGTAHGLWSSRLPQGGTDLEALWASAATTSASNVLTVTGEDVAAQPDPFNDLFTIQLNAANPDYLEVLWFDPVSMTDVIQFAGKINSVGRIEVDGGLGANVVIVAPDVVTGIGAGNITIVNANAPRVTDVVISSTMSGDSHAFAAVIDAERQNPSPRTGVQLDVVPVAGANTVEIVFSEPIANPTSAAVENALTLYGSQTGNVPTPTGYSYDAMTNTGTWSFTGWTFVDRYAIRLDASAITSAASGAELDGEWVNPLDDSTTDLSVSTFATMGDGSAGGDFVFVATLAPGDGNLDGTVDLLDLDILGANFGQTVLNDHLAHGDFNGDGTVDLLDLDLMGANFGDTVDAALMLLADLTGDGLLVDEDDELLLLTQGDFDNDGTVEQEEIDFFYAWLGFQGVA